MTHNSNQFKFGKQYYKVKRILRQKKKVFEFQEGLQKFWEFAILNEYGAWENHRVQHNLVGHERKHVQNSHSLLPVAAKIGG
jgi:hypothetical protein